MYLRAAAGDKAWHFARQYANLTVDDAWLIEPYGHLSYAGLLAEMEKHDFHTTVAFIPWNFDRSRPDVVSIVRAHPDDSRSVCTAMIMIMQNFLCCCRVKRSRRAIAGKTPLKFGRRWLE